MNAPPVISVLLNSPVLQFFALCTKVEVVGGGGGGGGGWGDS